MVNAILAGILSFLIPGLGHAIAGRVKPGIRFFIIWLLIGIIAAFIFQHWIVKVIDLLFCIFAAYDAYVRTRPRI